MEKLTFKQIYKEELQKLVNEMERRHKFYMQLEDYKFKTGVIPSKYLPEWTAWISDGRKHWKKIPGVWRKTKKTARKAAGNRMKNEKNS